MRLDETVLRLLDRTVQCVRASTVLKLESRVLFRSEPQEATIRHRPNRTSGLKIKRNDVRPAFIEWTRATVVPVQYWYRINVIVALLSYYSRTIVVLTPTCSIVRVTSRRCDDGKTVRRESGRYNKIASTSLLRIPV